MKRLFYVFLTAFVLIAIFDSCKKPGKTTVNPPPPGALVLWPNVHIVDSTQWILYSTDGQNYSYIFTPTTPAINVNVGDIIVGATNGGYIRKITGINLNNDRFNLETTQATMADVFKSGTFTLQLPINLSGQTNQDILQNYSNVNIYSTTGFNATMLYGQFNIQPSLVATFAFDSTGLTNFQMSTTNTTLKDTFAFAAVGGEPRVIQGQTTLSTIGANTTRWVMAYGNISVPVVVQLSLTFSAVTAGALYYSGITTSTGVNLKAYWSSNQAFSAGLQYSGGQWQPIHSSLAYNSIAIDSTSSIVNSALTVASTAQINSVFYGVPGPQITVGYTGQMIQVLNLNYPDFNQGLMAFNSITDAQTVTPVFGRNMSTFNQTWTYDTVSYNTPTQLTLVSGSGDTADVLNPYPAPLVVKVTDSYGNPVANTLVTFTVLGTGGDGTIGGNGATVVNVFTNQNGLAQTTWILGQQFYQNAGPQKVQATVLNGYLQPIGGAPIVFLGYGG